jgi:hypothetical protein
MSSFVICRLVAANSRIGKSYSARSACRSVSPADCGGPEERASDVRSRRIAPARKELRNGSSKSEHEPTTTRSTSYGSGHLIRVFHDIGRIFSLPFLLSHPSPVGHPLRGRVQKWKTEYGFVEGKNGFNCVSCGTHPVEEPAACHSPKRKPRTHRKRAGLVRVPTPTRKKPRQQGRGVGWDLRVTGFTVTIER